MSTGKTAAFGQMLMATGAGGNALTADVKPRLAIPQGVVTQEMIVAKLSALREHCHAGDIDAAYDTRSQLLNIVSRYAEHAIDAAFQQLTGKGA